MSRHVFEVSGFVRARVEVEINGSCDIIREVIHRGPLSPDILLDLASEDRLKLILDKQDVGEYWLSESEVVTPYTLRYVGPDVDLDGRNAQQ